MYWRARRSKGALSRENREGVFDSAVQKCTRGARVDGLPGAADDRPITTARKSAAREDRMKRTLAGLLAAIALATATPAGAQISDDVVKIGLILDMSSIYADITGKGSADAGQMAIDDFGGKVLGKPIELVYADHQNKADIGAAKAREWFENDHVDAILDVAASATALPPVELTKQKNKIIVFNGPAAPRLTNEACTPLSV